MIRKAQISDAESISTCHRDAILAVDRRFYSDAEVAAWSAGTNLQKYIDPITNDEIYVEEGNSAICGFGWLKFEPAEIRGVYVTPSEQGRDLGTKILKFLESTLRENGAVSIMVGASLNAQRFYENHSYQVVSQEVLDM